MIGLEDAIQSFLRGFTFTRSFTHPYLIVKEGPLWVMRDAARTRGHARKEEIVAYGLTVDETIRAIRAYRPQRYALCVIHAIGESALEVKQSYKAQGMRLIASEPLFVCRTQDFGVTDSQIVMRRVESAEDAQRVKAAARARQILPEHLGSDDAPLRLFAAFADNQAIGWVRSIRTGPDSAWVSNMFVQEPFRRQGIARSLMSMMLSDDARLGIAYSVLLASNAGSKLYPAVGYEQIGLLHLFLPKA